MTLFDALALILCDVSLRSFSHIRHFSPLYIHLWFKSPTSEPLALFRSVSGIICFLHSDTLSNSSAVWHGLISIANFNCLNNPVCRPSIAISFVLTFPLFLSFFFHSSSKTKTTQREYYGETGCPQKTQDERAKEGSSWFYYIFFYLV